MMMVTRKSFMGLEMTVEVVIMEEDGLEVCFREEGTAGGILN